MEYQIETLHKMGKNAIDKKDPAFELDKKVVGVSFSENRKIKDPGTGSIDSKPVKPWMVNQTQVLLERDRFIFSKDDEMLWKQMENYRVEKISINGVPRFTSVNEHAVDALMLCVLAIVDNLPELTNFVTRFDPTRHMAIAPSIRTPSLALRGDNDEPEIEYSVSGRKTKDKQVWFKVNDLREPRNSANNNITAYNIYRGSPFTPRGHTKRKRVSRARI